MSNTIDPLLLQHGDLQGLHNVTKDSVTNSHPGVVWRGQRRSPGSTPWGTLAAGVPTKRISKQASLNLHGGSWMQSTFTSGKAHVDKREIVSRPWLRKGFLCYLICLRKEFGKNLGPGIWSWGFIMVRLVELACWQAENVLHDLWHAGSKPIWAVVLCYSWLQSGAKICKCKVCLRANCGQHLEPLLVVSALFVYLSMK